MFLKGIFLRNALKNPHQKQMNNKYIYTHIYMHLNKVLQKFSTARPSSSVAKHKLLITPTKKNI
jgi:hypothetical protein